MSELKPKISERLDAILGIDQPMIDEGESKELVLAGAGGVPALPPGVISSGNPERDFNDDFATVRSTLHNLIVKGNNLTDDANYIAKEKQDSKSIEAAAIAQKEARESALALIDIYGKRSDIEKNGGKSGGDTINTQNNAVFVGTTGDLLRLTRDLNKNGSLQDTLKSLQEGEPAIDATATEINIQEDTDAKS
jgi:hypothetical protein